MSSRSTPIWVTPARAKGWWPGVDLAALRAATSRTPDEDRQRSGRILFAEPSTQAVLGVLADRAVHDGGHVQADEITSEVLGRVHRGQNGNGRSLGLRS